MQRVSMNFKEYLEYAEDSTTGLKWKIDRNNRVKKGGIAGSLDKSTNYFRVSVNNKLYYCHRIVWDIVNGNIPEGYNIDHIDGNSMNNNVNNLRLADQKANVRNRKKNVANTKGITGVWFSKYSICPAWYAGWTDLSGKGRTKSFSVRKFGDENAFIMAWEYRKKMIKQMNEMGAVYTERHGV